MIDISNKIRSINVQEALHIFIARADRATLIHLKLGGRSRGDLSRVIYIEYLTIYF